MLPWVSAPGGESLTAWELWSKGLENRENNLARCPDIVSALGALRGVSEGQPQESHCHQPNKAITTSRSGAGLLRGGITQAAHKQRCWLPCSCGGHMGWHLRTEIPQDSG